MELDSVELGWLYRNTDLNGSVEEEWFSWLSGVVRVLRDSTSMIEIKQDLEQVLTKLITKEKEETHDRRKMDSIIHVQKLVYKAQYRFTKLAETLYQSAQTCLLDLKSGKAEPNIVFSSFLEYLNNDTLIQLKSAHQGTVEASESIRDLKNLLDSRKRKNGKLLEPVEGTSVVLVGIAGWGVGSLLGVSFVKSIICVIVGALSFVFVLRMGKKEIDEVKVTTDDDTTLEDANFQAAVSLSNIENQIKALINTQLNRDEIYSEFSVGSNSLTDLLQKIETASQHYLGLAESNYGPLSYRREHDEESSSDSDEE